MRFLVPALALILLPAAAEAAQPITGNWVVEDGKAVVTIAPCGPATCGRISRLTRLARPGITTDVNNTDPKLRTRPLVGLPILTGFTDSGSDWRGQIYSPEEGKTYKSILARNPDGTLKVKGCIMFFCKTQTWRPER